MTDYEGAMRAMKAVLASPPEGWFTFGTHADCPDQELEFWGADGTGTPIWERPIPQTITPEKFEEARLAFTEAWEDASYRIRWGTLQATPGTRSTVGMIAALRVLGIEREPKRELL